MPDDDSPLLRQAVQGDADALADLLKKYAPSVRRTLSGKIPDHLQSLVDEDDVMQQTYADAFADIERFSPEGDGTFAGWLCRLAQYNLRDALRMLNAAKRGGRHNRVASENNTPSALSLWSILSSSGTSPSGCAAANEASSALERAIEKLPPVYRLVVQSHDLKGERVESIAERIGRSPGAVYMIRARAHDRLRGLLGATGNFFTDGA